MKKIIVSILLVGFGSFALADANKVATYKCNSKLEKISATFEQNGILESSMMKYSHGKIKFKSDISIEPTVLGYLVSGRVAELSKPDKENIYVSLVLPKINFKGDLTKVNFNTTVAETKSATTMAGENGVTGIIQKSRYFFVNCFGERN